MNKQHNTNGNGAVARVVSQQDRGRYLANARGTFRESDAAILNATGEIPLSLGSTLCDDAEDLFLSAVAYAYQKGKSRKTSGFEDTQLSPNDIIDFVVGGDQVKNTYRDLVVRKQASGTRIINIALPGDHFATGLIVAVLEDQGLEDVVGVDMSQFSVRFVGGAPCEPIQLCPPEDASQGALGDGHVIDGNATQVADTNNEADNTDAAREA
jgi:hypothetical protein